MTDKPKQKRGFALMPPEQRKKIASMGGQASKGGGRPRKVRSEAGSA